VRSAAAVADGCIDSGSAADLDDQPLARRRATLVADATALAEGGGTDGRHRRRHLQRFESRFGRRAARAAMHDADRRRHRVGNRHARSLSWPRVWGASAGGDPPPLGGWATAR